MTKIPFGEHNLTLSHVNKMGKALWETNNTESEYGTTLSWSKLRDRDREEFVREFILIIVTNFVDKYVQRAFGQQGL